MWAKIAKNTVLALLALFGAVYLFGAVKFAFFEEAIDVFPGPGEENRVIAILGASGTAGDGILKAALADDSIEKIHVVTRRTTPRIDAGVAAGKIQMTLHQDYLNYSALREQLSESTAVFWAIGTSTFGVDEETYAKIHVEFPKRFVLEWLATNDESALTFHYISSSDISADSRAMWARQKYRAELTLFELADQTNLKVVAYRPDYIGPTEEQAHLGQRILYGFFAPVRAAIKAREIGEAMLEVTARGDEFKNGDKLNTVKLIRYADAYRRRINQE